MFHYVLLLLDSRSKSRKQSKKSKKEKQHKKVIFCIWFCELPIWSDSYMLYLKKNKQTYLFILFWSRKGRKRSSINVKRTRNLKEEKKTRDLFRSPRLCMQLSDYSRPHLTSRCLFLLVCPFVCRSASCSVAAIFFTHCCRWTISFWNFISRHFTCSIWTNRINMSFPFMLLHLFHKMWTIGWSSTL